jgi:hypothetical protein
MIDINGDEEALLRAEAQTHGVPVEECARHILARQLQAPLNAQPTLLLLESWDREDATDNPEELAARQREWSELDKALASGRLLLRGPETETP